MGTNTPVDIDFVELSDTNPPPAVSPSLPIPFEDQPHTLVIDKKAPWWTWPMFPLADNGNISPVAPQVLKDLIDGYTQDALPINDHLSMLGITYFTFNSIIHKYPEVEAYYRLAQKDKAHSYNHDAIKLYQDEIPKEFWQIDKFGNRVLVMAGVRYLENKKDLLLRQAEIHEMGTYHQRVSVESRNLNLNVNMNVDVDIDDLAKMSVDALMKPLD